jgi:hypothetical protein
LPLKRLEKPAAREAGDRRLNLREAALVGLEPARIRMLAERARASLPHTARAAAVVALGALEQPETQAFQDRAERARRQPLLARQSCMPQAGGVKTTL